MPVVRSAEGRSARPPVGTVLVSTAAYSGERPQVSHLFTSAPCFTSSAAVSKFRFSAASSSGVTRSGSVRFTSARPSSSRMRAHSAQPRRAANSSGVMPPDGRACMRGSAVTCRSKLFSSERASASAPALSSSRTIAGCPSAAAHINAVWLRQVSRWSTLAPRFSSSLAASTLLVRATIISAVWPSGLAASTLAPAFSRRSITSTLPATAASDSGVEP